ncbi:MAG: N-acetylmuramic acid 6-phosphate etherase [Candidatus Nanopelagicaceae bacterium]|nr:N-acetylmuramic acid 6-phosphate etherase [Candidatus Nanopelagicaceae bacterium]
MGSTEDSSLGLLRTEQVDSKFRHLDQMSVAELLRAMNEGDAEVPRVIAIELPKIERAIESIVERMMRGGRLIYIGAGTSGRLGVLDAAECGPTFSVSEDQVLGLMAGGERALIHAVEGAEDDFQAGEQDLISINLRPADCVVGIAASGRTPYVRGALAYARQVGALTIGLTSNLDSEMSKDVEHPLEIDTGPELLAGSTRLKSGTAQKLVLNMISTITMVRLGKTFGNLMVDLQITNEKLRDRAVRIIMQATGAPYTKATAVLEESGNEVKVAILMLLLGVDAPSARVRLQAASNRVQDALNLR